MVGKPRGRNFLTKAALLMIATNQERFYLQNNTYTADMSALGFQDAGANLTDSETYSVVVNAADANNFTATATYQKADNEAGKCQTFQIDGRGQKTSAPLGDSWTRTR